MVGSFGSSVTYCCATTKTATSQDGYEPSLKGAVSRRLPRGQERRIPRLLLWPAAIAGAIALLITWMYGDTLTFFAVALWAVAITLGVTAGARLQPDTVAAKVTAIILLGLVLAEVIVVVLLLVRYVPGILGAL